MSKLSSCIYTIMETGTLSTDILIVILALIGIWRDVMIIKCDQSFNPEPPRYAIYWCNMAIAMIRFVLAFYFKYKPLNIIMIIFCGIAIIRGCIGFVQYKLYCQKSNAQKQSFL